MLIRSLIGILIVILISIGSVIPSHAWFIYHKPKFQGTVIDAETKEPIEGAVVVVIYNEGIFGFAESITKFLDVKEAVTDQKGEFYIPSYTTLTINPLSIASEMWVNIFKSGYGGVSGLWGEWQKRELQAPKGTYVIESGRPIIVLKKRTSIKEEEKHLYKLYIPTHEISCEKIKELQWYEEFKKEARMLGVKIIMPCKEGAIEE